MDFQDVLKEYQKELGTDGNVIATIAEQNPIYKCDSGQVRQIMSTPYGEALIIYTARVSSPHQAKKGIKRLLTHCVNHGHWSVFEQADLTIEVICPLAISIQILRHRSFCFQQFCLSGDSQIYFDLPGAVEKGKRHLYKMTIAELYRKWNNNQHKKQSLQSMNVRVWDENTKQFTHSHIKEVFQTGIKPIFEVKLKDGKTIKTTKEHKFLTPNGFQSLEEAVGLEFRSGHWGWTKKAVFGTNGTPVHQDKKWLNEAKTFCINNKTGVSGIAELAGVGYDTIRKWLRVHGLQFKKSEVSQCYNPWNKGLLGFNKGRKHTPETIEKMKDKAKRGKDNPLWKGGVDRSERLKITDYISSFRTQLLRDADYKCAECGGSRNLELHHIKPVYSHPELAYDLDNISVLCEECHDKIHKLEGHNQEWRDKSLGNKLTTKWVEIESVSYVGEEMTYDLEIDHSSHNYVANGLVVHNSQRYADVNLLTCDFAYVPLRLREQDTSNRQNSIPWSQSEELHQELTQDIIDYYDHSMRVYNKLLDNGVAKEVARFVLPEGVYTKMYIKGNVRSWIHYLKVRNNEGVQAEHIWVAQQMTKVFRDNYPIIHDIAFNENKNL